MSAGRKNTLIKKELMIIKVEDILLNSRLRFTPDLVL